MLAPTLPIVRALTSNDIVNLINILRRPTTQINGLDEATIVVNIAQKLASSLQSPTEPVLPDETT